MIKKIKSVTISQLIKILLFSFIYCLKVWLSFMVFNASFINMSAMYIYINREGIGKGVIGCWPIKNYTFRGKRQILSYIIRDEHVTYSSNKLEQNFSVFQIHVHPIFLFFWTILLHLLNKLKIIHVHSSPMLAKHAL